MGEYVKTRAWLASMLVRCAQLSGSDFPSWLPRMYWLNPPLVTYNRTE